MKQAIGIDLGGTQIKGALVDEFGEVLQREAIATVDDFPTAIRRMVEALGAGLPVSISAPGLASRDRRSIAHMPGRLAGLAGLDWTDFLGRSQLVPVTNDGQSALIGEAWVGAARGLRDAVLITLGTGVGGAILSDGKILRGHLGRAGHVGHLCLDPNGKPSITGMPGALEEWIGNASIQERSGGRFASTHALIDACREGDEDACGIWLKSVRGLACAIASLINIVDPEAVIIGGGISAGGDALFTPLEAELSQIEWRPGGNVVRIVPAALGDWAGAIGAARTALDLE